MLQFPLFTSQGNLRVRRACESRRSIQCMEVGWDVSWLQLLCGVKTQDFFISLLRVLVTEQMPNKEKLLKGSKHVCSGFIQESLLPEGTFKTEEAELGWTESCKVKKNLIFWENAFVVSGSCVPWRLKEQAVQNLTGVDLNPDSLSSIKLGDSEQVI